MRVLAIVLVSFVCSALSIEDEELLNEWRRFQVNYGKTYRSPLEARKRLAIFKNNLDHIQSHNDLFRKGETTFTKGINKFADWTEDEFMQYVGRGLPREISVRSEKSFKKTEGFKIPESVDWREEGAVKPVGDQGDCWSSYAFAATGTIEGQFRIKKNLNVSLSEQYLVDCDSDNDGCLSGSPFVSFIYARDRGIVTEEDFPYIGKETRCAFNSSNVFHIAGYVLISKGDEEALQEALSTEGPVSITYLARNNFQFYEGGVYKDLLCRDDRYNLSLLLVGFGSENGQKYYIARNSWGADWGESGYIRLARNKNNMCGVASDAILVAL